jgi:hypothetical protein
MDEKIKQQIRSQKIREMKNPTIMMNKTDFENFKKDVESKVVNLKVGLNPTYEGVPIKTNDLIEIGNMVIYDDVLQAVP